LFGEANLLDSVEPGDRAEDIDPGALPSARGSTGRVSRRGAPGGHAAWTRTSKKSTGAWAKV